MKKIIVFIIAIVAVCYTPSYATNPSVPATPDQCVTAGNVSATVKDIDSSSPYVDFVNYNSYRVSVSYTVTALDSNGRKVEVGGGSVSLGASGSGSTERVRIAGGYTGYSVKISVYKCS